MVEHREAREMSKAAKELARAAEELHQAAAAIQRTWQDYERVLEELRAAGVELEKIQRARLGDRILSGGLPEEVAAVVADESVHRVRKELARERADEPKAPPPTLEEIEEWKRRRDEQRHEAP